MKKSVTPRQAQILAAIVKEYANSGEPIGSEVLTDRYDFQFSAATIRNEMQALERAGYIHQPHTSAGRVPTDAGYRFFITKLLRHVELSAREQARLRTELTKLQEVHAELGRSITRILAETSNSAAFALLPESASSAGFSNIVDSGMNRQDLKQVAKFFDNLKEESRALVVKNIGSVQTYVGTEAPIALSDDVSMLVSQVKLPGGQKGVVGIVGPKRMKYGKNISLLEYISKLLSSGLGVYAIISILH